MILIVGHNSTWQVTYRLPRLDLDAVNRIGSMATAASGKGVNVARALHDLGRQVRLLGYCGGATGDRFEEALAGEGLPATLTRIAAETRRAMTFIEDGSRVTELIEPSPQVTNRERDQMFESVTGQLDGAALFAIVGTSVEGERDDVYGRYVEQAKQCGVPVLLDSYRAHGTAALAAGPDILKVNEHELGEIVGRTLDGRADRFRAAAEVAGAHDIAWVIVTCGADGVEARGDGLELVCEIPSVPIANTIGSGDAVNAGILAVLEGRRSNGSGALDASALQDAVRFGAILGTANCRTPVPGQIERAHIDEVAAGVHCEARP